MEIHTQRKKISGINRRTGPEPTAQTELLRAMKTSHHRFSTGFNTGRPHGAKSVCECVKGGAHSFMAWRICHSTQKHKCRIQEGGSHAWFTTFLFKNPLDCVCWYKDNDMWWCDASSWFQLFQQQQPEVERELTTEQRSTETGHTRQASPLRWYKVTQSFYDTVKTKQCCRH